MLLVLDVETTGLDAAIDCILELATVDVTSRPWRTFQTLVAPTAPIQLPAMATHHITPPMLRGAPVLDNALSRSGVREATCLVAHNAAFDRAFIKREDVPWICTYRCSRQLFPNSPGYGNQVLRYWLALDEEIHKDDGAAIMSGLPHRALPDAWITAHLLTRLLLMRTVEQLQQLTLAPILLDSVGFGKHYGMKWSVVPRDYLKWVLRNDFDEDTKHTARYYYGR